MVFSKLNSGVCSLQYWFYSLSLLRYLPFPETHFSAKHWSQVNMLFQEIQLDQNNVPEVQNEKLMKIENGSFRFLNNRWGPIVKYESFVLEKQPWKHSLIGVVILGHMILLCTIGLRTFYTWHGSLNTQRYENSVKDWQGKKTDLNGSFKKRIWHCGLSGEALLWYLVLPDYWLTCSDNPCAPCLRLSHCISCSSKKEVWVLTHLL